MNQVAQTVGLTTKPAVTLDEFVKNTLIQVRDPRVRTRAYALTKGLIAGNKDTDDYWEWHDTRDALIEEIALRAIQSLCQPRGGIVPKVHHYIPVFYLARFAANANASRKNLRLPSTTFTDGVAEVSRTHHKSFAHPARGDRGYYDLELEFFFSNIETTFAGITLEQEALTLSNRRALVLFMAIQHLRSPNIDGKFSLRTLAEALEKIEEFIPTSVDALIIETGTDVPLVENVPALSVTFAEGTLNVMPFNKNSVIVVGSNPKALNRAASVANRYRETMIKRAKANGTALLGNGNFA